MYSLVYIRLISALAVLLLLAACSSGMNAAVESVRQIVLPPTQPETSKLDPKFAYLRVTRGWHVGLLWRGNVEKGPAGPVEVYYSSTGEVLRLQNGRIVGALGLSTEWRHVTVQAPAWSSAAKTSAAEVMRLRDVMPGYRSGVRDELALRRVGVPSRNTLKGIDPAALTWFEEAARERGFRLPGVASETLPAALYAVSFEGGQETVVYSEQCLAADLCFTWQRWSAAMQQTTAPKQP